MKELIEYLERKIELCTEMNMPLEKFAYTDALKKARVLQLQQTGVVLRSEQLKCYHDNHEWKSDGEGGFFKYCKDCKDYV